MLARVTRSAGRSLRSNRALRPQRNALAPSRSVFHYVPENEGKKPEDHVLENDEEKIGDNEFPTIWNAGVGEYYEEAIAWKERETNGHGLPWRLSAAGYGPFGTIDFPKKVPTGFNSRVVVCNGAGERVHEPVWMSIDGDLPHMCQHCGQFFQLYHGIYDVSEGTPWEDSAFPAH